MRLGPWQQAAVYAALVIVGLTGLVWFALHDFVEEEPSELRSMHRCRAPRPT